MVTFCNDVVTPSPFPQPLLNFPSDWLRGTPMKKRARRERNEVICVAVLIDRSELSIKEEEKSDSQEGTM